MRIVNKRDTISTEEKDCMERALGFIREGLKEASVNRRLAIKAKKFQNRRNSFIMLCSKKAACRAA